MSAQHQPADGLIRWREPTQIELTPILTAALEAFYETGYHGTSVRDIARRVGGSVPLIYYHHENKEAVLLALLNRSIDHVIVLCEAALAEAGDDPELRFCNLVEALVLFEAFTPRTAFLDTEMRALQPTNLEKYAARRDHVEDLLHAAIEGGAAVGIFEVHQPRDTARALLGMIQAVWTWYHPGGPQSPQDVAALYVELAARCVGVNGDTMAHIQSRYAAQNRASGVATTHKASAAVE